MAMKAVGRYGEAHAAAGPSRPGRRAALGLGLALAALAGVPSLSVAQPPPASGAEPEPAPPAICLVLPLESPALGRAADAVRAGFAAAAAAAKVDYRLVAHGDGDVLGAFASARDGGARVIVGPLARDDIRAIATAGAPLPWTIALNQPEEGTVLPDHVFTLTLAVDADARQVARRMRADGAQSIAVIGSDSPVQKRFASAFIGEWILQGGGPPATFRLDRSPDMLVALRRELARTAPDAVVLALDGADAALVKPYAGQAPAYASSLVNDRLPPQSMRDLEDVRFVETTWLGEPDAAFLAGLPRPDFANAALDRLYALGIDALRVAQAFVDGPPDRLEFDGATGRVVLEGSRQFDRQGRWMAFRAGRIVPANGP
jgi:hypothetical protein